MSNVRAGVDLFKLSVAPTPAEQEKAKRIHTQIRAHLESDPNLAKYSVNTRLQGSYRHSTNVREDSDVDMNCRTASIYQSELNWLNKTPAHTGQPSELQRYEATRIPASFTFLDYRADVLASLIRKYGSSVVNGNKAIKVAGNTNRMDADVLPCIEHRRYRYFNSSTDNDFARGVAFQAKNGGRWFINYPEQNHENLTTKNVATGGKVKDTVRIVKRIRNLMSAAGSWDMERSPSFYLECLIWNAPSYLFDGSHGDVVFNVLKYLHSDLTEKKGTQELNSYKQTNDIFFLFHNDFWNVDDAIAFIERAWGFVFE